MADIEIISADRAYEIASQWGSLIRNGDPGAVFYTFPTNDATPQGERHRAQLLAYTQTCLAELSADRDDYAECKEELEELKLFFEHMPATGEEAKAEFADENAALRDGADAFTTAYITAALWTGVERAEGHPDKDSDKEYDLDPDLIQPATLRAMIADCQAFREKAGALLSEALARPDYSHQESGPEEMAGHDFWLTRNGHGAGFWDRTALEADDLGDKLSKVAKSFGEYDLGQDHDGTVSRS